MNEVHGSTTLRRGLALLMALGTEEAAESGGFGVMQLAERTGEDKAQVSRTLKVLHSIGLVDRDPVTQTYSLGWEIYGLAARSGHRRLLREAPAVLKSLVDELGESAHLTVLQGNEVMTIWTESPALAIRAVNWIGRTVPAWSTSTGRVLLADYDEERMNLMFDGVEFESIGTNAPTNVSELYQRVCQGVDAGYVLVDEEFEPGLVSVAAPIRAYHGQVIAAINVSGPKYRFGHSLDRAGLLTKKAADGLTILLGGTSQGSSR